MQQMQPRRQAAVAHSPPGALARRAIYIVGVDASPSARSALSVAAGIARELDSAVVLVHAFVPTWPPTFSSACGSLRSYRAELCDAERLLREAAEAVSDVVIGTELRYGDPAQAISQLAQEVAAELIVVGSRRLGKLDRLLLGSVSRGVVERAPCSVLVVRVCVADHRSAALVPRGRAQ